MDFVIRGADPVLLKSIDQEAKEKGKSRNQWILEILSSETEGVLFSKQESQYHELVEKLCGVVENNTAALARQSSVIEKLLYETEEQDAEILPTDTLE